MCGRHCRVASRRPRAEYNGERRIGLLTPVFAQSSPNRSRESVAVVRSVPIKIGPPSSSEGRERTVFSCLRDRRTASACAHYVCHTPSGESPAFAVIFSAFSDESSLLFAPSCPFSPASLLRADTPFAEWREGVADRRCDVCCAGRPPTGLASALGGGDKCRPECRAPSDDHDGASGGCRRPARGGGAG